MLKNRYSHGNFEANLNRKTIPKSGIEILYNDVCFATVYPFLKLISSSVLSKHFSTSKTVIGSDDLILHFSENIASMADKLPFFKDEFNDIILIAREIANDVNQSLFMSKGYHKIIPIATRDVNFEYDFALNVDRGTKLWSSFLDNEGGEKEYNRNPFEKKIKVIETNSYNNFIFNGMCVNNDEKLTIMSYSEIKRINENGITPKQIIDSVHMSHDVCYDHGIRSNHNNFYIPSGVKLDVDIRTPARTIVLVGNDNKYDGSNITINYNGGRRLNRVLDINVNGDYAILPKVNINETEDNSKFSIMFFNPSSVYEEKSFRAFYKSVHDSGGAIDIHSTDREKASRFFLVGYMMKRFNETNTSELKKAYDKIGFKGTIEQFRAQWNMFIELSMDNHNQFPCPVGSYKEGIDKLKERIDYTCDMLVG